LAPASLPGHSACRTMLLKGVTRGGKINTSPAAQPPKADCLSPGVDPCLVFVSRANACFGGSSALRPPPSSPTIAELRWRFTGLQVMSDERRRFDRHEGTQHYIRLTGRQSAVPILSWLKRGSRRAGIQTQRQIQKEEAGGGSPPTLTPPEIIPAATYSPTQLPAQYHRPWRA
jgi:hypothetical protein